MLLEHQSGPDALMPLRLLVYLVRIWQDHRRSAKRASKPALPLPVIIPLVMHHGSSGWATARHFHELFDPALLELDGVAELLPSFRFLLDDLPRASDAALQARALQRAELLVPLVLWALRDARSRDRLLHSLVAWGPVIQATWQTEDGSETLVSLLSYISMVTPDLSEQDFAHALNNALPQSHGSLMATLAEQWMQRGIEKGLQKGLVRGIDQGLAHGRRQTLARQLELKFGPAPAWAQARLDNASPEELTRWTERVLTAASLDELFAVDTA